METRSSSRIKHKLEDEKESPPKKLKSTKKATESPKVKKTKTQSPKKKAASPKKKSSKKESETATDKPVLHESSTLEKGQHQEAHNADDVQRLYPNKTPERKRAVLYSRRERDDRGVTDFLTVFTYMVLKPEKESGSTPMGKNRLIVMTAKRLPDAKKHSRFWAFVEHTSHDIDEITKKLEPVDYETKTKGDRHLEGCRPCGCGVYSIVHHLAGKYKSGTHTHIAYVMEIPEKLGEVQKAFQIQQEGSFIVTVKNPKSAQDRGLGPSKRADYPEAIQKLFGTRKFIPAEPTTLLDYDGTELILIGAQDDIVQDLGKPGEELEEEAEEEEEEEEKKHHDHRCSMAEEQVFHNMRDMHHKEHPAEPLLEGKWE